jgi:carboxypeptidase family protein
MCGRSLRHAAVAAGFLLLNVALILALAEEPASPAEDLAILSVQKPADARVLLLDAAAHAPARSPRVLDGGAETRVPHSRYIVLGVTPAGASAATVDLTRDSRVSVRLPDPRAGTGVWIARIIATRVARQARLADVRLRARSGEARAPSAIMGDVLIFNEVARDGEPQLVPPAHSCFETPVEERFAKEPWIFREVHLGICSSLSVNVAGVPESRVDAVLKLRSEKSLLVERRWTPRANPVAFPDLAPGSYSLELSVGAYPNMPRATDTVQVGFESAAEHRMSARFVHAHGRATWGDARAAGTIEVSCGNKPETVKSTATLDDDGHYDLWLMKPGLCMAMLTPADREPSRGGPTIWVTVPETGDSELDLKFPRAALAGTVADTEGQPLSDTRVTAFVRNGDDAKMTFATTDENGAFHFDFLQEGDLRLEAARAGYRQERVVQLAMAPDAEAFATIVMQRVHSASVSILAPDGAPAANVSVYCASDKEDAMWQRVGVSDTAGAITINTDGSLPMPCAVPSVSAGLGTFALTSEEPATWRLPVPAGRLTLRLLHDDGSPFDDVQILLRQNGLYVGVFPLSEQLGFRGGTDRASSAGIVTLAGLGPGDVEIYQWAHDTSHISAAEGGEDDRLCEVQLSEGEDQTITISVPE